MPGSQGIYRTPAMGVVGLDDRSIEGQFMDLHLSRQGALITEDILLAWAIEGRTFHAQQGNAITLVDFVETVYDEDQPQFALLVPTGVTAIPLRLAINFQDQAGTDNHVAVSTCTNNIGVGTSTALTESPMRTDAPHGAQCSAQSLYTGNATAATGLIEIDRVIDPFVATAAGRLPGYRWDIKSNSAIPVLVGPATLQIHAYSTTDGGEGFGEYIWAEFPTPDLVRKV